jgi:hypothetical protein
MGCKMYLLQLTDSQISYADTDLYPNVHVILKLLLTLSVRSCACERSFSALRMINEWKKEVNAIVIFETFDWGV